MPHHHYLTSSQIDVVTKLLPRVQYLQSRGLTQQQIIDTLVVGEGWSHGAVMDTLDRIKRMRPNRSSAT
jgi:hypothetical protein